MFCLWPCPLLLQMHTETFLLVPIGNILPCKMVPKATKTAKKIGRDYDQILCKNICLVPFFLRLQKEIDRDARRNYPFHCAKEHKNTPGQVDFPGGNIWKTF